MAKGIGTLAAVLSMNSKDFTAGIKQAERGVVGLTQNTRRAEGAISQSVAKKQAAFDRLNRSVNSSVGGFTRLRSTLLTQVSAATAASAAILRLATGYHRAQEEAARFSSRMTKMSHADAASSLKERISELEVWLGGRGLDQFQLRMRSIFTGEWKGQKEILTLLKRQLEVRERLRANEEERNRVAEEGRRIEERRTEWLAGIETAAQREARINGVIADRSKAIREEVAKLEAQMQAEALDAAGRLTKEYEERMRLAKELRSIGERHDVDRAIGLERAAREALERGMEELRTPDGKPDTPMPDRHKDAIEALVRGSAGEQAFTHDSRRNRELEENKRQTKILLTQDRRLAAIEQNTAEGQEVVINF